MGLHEWSKVSSGLFHHFHQGWCWVIADALNKKCLPKGYSALVEQRTFPREADVLAVEGFGNDALGGIATLPRPQVRHKRAIDHYASKANRVSIKHRLGRTVAVIEIVSPGNKDSKKSVRDFTEKSMEYFRAGVHLLIVDILAPTRPAPDGLHSALMEELGDDATPLPPGRNRFAVSYQLDETEDEYGYDLKAFRAGDPLPEMPLYLSVEGGVMVPLAETYATAWDACPEALKDAVNS